MATRELAYSVISNGEKNLANGAAAIKSETSDKLIGLTKNLPALASVAVGFTVLALDAAYSSIESHRCADLSAFDKFRQDCDTGTVTYFLPNRESDFSEGQKFFRLFRKNLLEKFSVRFLNLHTTENMHQFISSWTGRNNKISGTNFSIISYFTLLSSNCYYECVHDDNNLETARRSCNLFLASKMTNILDKINSLQSHNPLDFNLSGHLKSNYFQRLNLVRFVVLSLSNILISLQYPQSLEDTETIELCEKFKILINEFLLSDSFSYLHTRINFESTQMVNFLTSLRREAEGLQNGYRLKALNQLSLYQVVGQCHGILQELNTLWHQILFQHKPQSDPDNLLYTVRCLTCALHDLAKAETLWSALLNCFWETVKEHNNSKNTQMIDIPSDVKSLRVLQLIKIFSALNSYERKSLLRELPKVGLDINELLLLNANFIDPIKEIFHEDEKTSEILVHLIAISVESRPTAIPEQPEGPDLFDDCVKRNEVNFDFFPSWELYSDKKSQKFDAKNFDILKKETVEGMRELIFIEYGFLSALREFAYLQAIVDKNVILLICEKNRAVLKQKLKCLMDIGNDLEKQIHKLYSFVNSNDKMVLLKGANKQHNMSRHFLLCALSDEGILQHRLKALVLEIQRIISLLHRTSGSETSEGSSLTLYIDSNGRKDKKLETSLAHFEYNHSDRLVFNNGNPSSPRRASLRSLPVSNATAVATSATRSPIFRYLFVWLWAIWAWTFGYAAD